MKLQFQSLLIENFKAFAGQHEFNLAQFGSGLHFIRGRNEDEPRLDPNGTGKSSLWDALSWALYGKTPDGSRNPDIKPWHGKTNTFVEVMLKIGRTEYAISREANPNALLLDDKPVGQEQIDKLIGLSFPAFCHTILLGQGRPLFFDLAPRDKLQLFSDVLNLDRWEVRSSAASERAKEFLSQQDMLLGKQIALIASQENTQKLHDEAKASSAEWRVNWGDRMRMAYEELEDVDRRLNAAQKTWDEVEPKHDWTRAQIKLIRTDLRKLEGASSVEFLERGRKAEVERGKFVDTCPTCGQKLDKATAAKARKEHEHTLEGFDAELAKARKAAKEKKRLGDSLTKLEHDADKLEATLQPLHNTISSLKGQQAALQGVLSEKEEEKNPYHSQLAKLKKQLREIKDSLTVTEAEIAKLGRRIERANFWVKGFKDVRLYVIEEVLQELELATNAALDDVGLVGWNVTYDVEKLTQSGTVQRGLNVLIMTPKMKNRVRWESWSGGEGQRLRVVGALALSEVLLNHAGIETALEILDEPAHFMAPEGVRDLTDFLAWRADGLGKKTFYIDHLAVESTRFSSTTTVVKDKNGARLELP